jgi:hypothetical protein
MHTRCPSFNEADRLLTESYSGGTLAGLSVNRTYIGYLQRDSVNIKNGATVLRSSGSFGATRPWSGRPNGDSP